MTQDTCEEIIEIPMFNEISESELNKLVDCLIEQRESKEAVQRLLLRRNGVNMLFDRKRIYVSSNSKVQSKFFVMVDPFRIVIDRNTIKIIGGTGMGILFEFPSYLNVKGFDNLFDGSKDE